MQIRFVSFLIVALCIIRQINAWSPYFTRRNCVGTSLHLAKDSGTGYFRLPNDGDDDAGSFIDEAAIFPLSNETKQIILSEMVLAFDNLPYSEVSDLLESIVISRDAYTCARLLELTRNMERIYAELRRRDASRGFEDLEDAARVIRSNIRIYANSHSAQQGNREPSAEFKWPW